MKGRALAAEDILAALNRHGVEYVVVRAFAAIAQGAAADATFDIDLTAKRNAENLRRLSPTPSVSSVPGSAPTRPRKACPSLTMRIPSPANRSST